MTEALDKALRAARDHASASVDDVLHIERVTAQVRNELQTILGAVVASSMTREMDTDARTSIANILRLMDALDGREP
jgi:hypothetical protein